MSKPVGKGETFPALVAHSLSRLLRWHIASPPSLSVVSLQNTYSYSQCSMDFMPVCLFFGCLPPWTFANPSCSIFFILSFFHCFILLMLMRFCFLCRHLLALSCSPLFILSYSGLASFLLCKGKASVMLQGSQSLLATKKFQRVWGAVAPGPNSLRPKD